MGAVFRKITVGRYGPVRAVEPQVVLEVSFGSIQKSTRHKSGFALRFPRIVRLRPDKTAAALTPPARLRWSMCPATSMLARVVPQLTLPPRAMAR